MSMPGILDSFPWAGMKAILDYLRSGALSSPGLAIAAAGSAAVKIAAFDFAIVGKVYEKAAVATQALAGIGTVAVGATKTAFLSLDASGTIAVTGVSQNSGGETIVPDPGVGSVLFGAVTVANGSTASFVGGTTALDASGLTVTYMGLSGAVPGEAL